MSSQNAAVVLDFHDKRMEDAYLAGYYQAMDEVREKQKLRRQEIRERKERKKYFLLQRFCGIVCFAITALAAHFLDGDITIAIITVPLGLTFLLSKQMMIVNDYYWEHEDQE